jgi:hypothetical protein
MTQRPVSGLERVWLAADRMAPPFVNQCVLTNLPAFDTARLEAAVARAAAVHPGVCVRLNGRLRSLRWVANGPPPRFTTPADPTWTARDERDAPWLRNPLDPQEGPVCEIVALQGATPDTRHIIVRTHHAALDGRGTQLFVEDLLAAYAGEPVRGAEAGPTYDLDLARPHAPKPRPEPPTDAISPTGASGPGDTHQWRRVTLPKLPSPVLPRVLLALAQAARTTGATGPLRIGLPVDLRRYTPDLRASANLTGVAPLTLPDPLPSLDTLRALVDAAAAGPDAAAHVLAADRLRGTPVWLMTLAGRLAAPSLRRKGRYPISVSVSNLGRHAYTLDGHPISAFWIPPPSPGLPLFMSTCGNATALELCAGSPEGIGGAGRLDALLAHMVQLLTAP